METRQIVDVPVDQIHRHPANRRIPKASCKGLAESLERRGLLSPIQIRRPGPKWDLPDGYYQIVFGERRWMAAQLAGWETIPAEIVELTDAETQEAITTENGQREALNDIQRADRLQWDMRPVADGGAGMTLTEAAAAMGIDHSTASNLLSVARLPKEWTDLIVSGETPGSVLRPIARYADCPAALQLLARERQKAAESQWHDDRHVWATRAGVERQVEEALCYETYALTPADKFCNQDYEIPAFNAESLSAAELTGLDVHEIQTPAGVTVRRAFNGDAWRKLQAAAAAANGKQGSGKHRSGKSDRSDTRKREAEQDRELVERLQRPGGLAEIGLRWAMAQRLQAGKQATELTYEVLIDAARETAGESDLDAHAWRYLGQRLLRMDRCPKGQSPGQIVGTANHEAYGRFTLTTFRAADDHVTDGERLRCYTAALILWPASERIEARGRLAPRGQLPERWPYIPPDLLAELAAELGAGVADTWSAAAKPGPARLWLQAVIATYSTRRHRLALARELSVDVAADAKLDAIGTAIVAAHSLQSRKLPAVLRGQQKRRQRSRA